MGLSNLFGGGSGGGTLPTFTAPVPNANARSIISKLGDVAVSVKDYGAVGNGSTDDTAAIQAAENALSTAGGGTLLFPDGTYIAAGLVKRSSTVWLGASRSGTILKLKAGATTDLITGANFATLTGGTSTSGIINFGVVNMTLDGNKANAASGGWGIRFYGYAHLIQNISVQNFAAGGIYTEWGGLQSVAATTISVGVLDAYDVGNCNGVGVYTNGPSDSTFTNGIVHGCGGNYGLYVGNNSGGAQISALHVWGQQTQTSATFGVAVFGTRCILTNIVTEGSYGGQLLVAGNWNEIRGLQAFAAGVNAAGTIAVQVGTTGYGATGNTVQGKVYDCQGGALQLNNDGGYNKIDLWVSLATGTVQGGTKGKATELDLKVDGTWTGGQAGGIKLSRNAYSAFTVDDGNYNDIFNINTVAGSRGFQLVNGTALAGFSDAYSTKTINLDPATAQISGVQVAAEGTLAITANGQTITPGTKGCLWLSSSLSAPITGIILATGAPGQELTLLNATGQTLTFAASGSNVNGGSGISIGSGGSKKFIFDSNWFLWWPV